MALLIITGDMEKDNMNAIGELLKVIGLPAIVATIVFIIRLESKIKINEIAISKINAEVVSYKNKQDILLEKINDNIGMLTTASVKHDLQLDNINSNISDFKGRMNTELENIRSHFDRMIEIQNNKE